MICNTAACMKKLTCTDFVESGKSGRFSGSKNDSNHVDVKIKVFNKDDIKEFRLVQNLAMGGADFHQFIQLMYQQVNAAENVSPVLIPTVSKDMDEQLEVAHKVVDVVDRANRKNCVTLLRYNVDKPESSYA